MNCKELDRQREQTFGPTTAPPGSFTSMDYAARYGLGHSKARADLAKLTAAGKLKKTLVKVKNVWVPYYSAVESPQEPTHEPARRGKHRGRSRRRRDLLPVG